MKVALITARGGSKGLPRKNVLPLAGKPLIAWSIEAALNCPDIDQVYVSTEDAEIAEVSRKYGAMLIDRPEELATDTASSEGVIEHAIHWLEQRKVCADTLVLLQPTSPLRTAQNITEAVQIYTVKKVSHVLSVFEPAHTPIKAYVECDDGSISGLYSKSAPYQRRQDLPRAFQPNGAIYVFSIEDFKRHNRIPRDNVFPYVMSEYDSADIDTYQDFVDVEHRIKNKG